METTDRLFDCLVKDHRSLPPPHLSADEYVEALDALTEGVDRERLDRETEEDRVHVRFVLHEDSPDYKTKEVNNGNV